MTSATLEKVILPVPADMDQGVRRESVWAESLGEGLYRLRNIPFLAEDFSIDDVVLARDRQGVLTYEAMSRPSPYSVFICFCSSESEASQLIEELNRWDARSEFGHDKEMMAIAVCGAQQFQAVRSLLERREKEGGLEYGELTVR